MYYTLCSKLDELYFTAKAGLYKIFREEDGEVNVVATVLLIGVAVALVLIFKESISNLVTNLLNKVETNAGKVMK